MPQITSGEVHLWLFRQTTPLPSGWNPSHHLSKPEVDRSARFKFSVDQERYWVRHSVLRNFLVRYGALTANDLQPLPLANGKPGPIGGIHFNLSDSDHLAVIAVSSHPVGVDIERARALADLEPIVDRFFAPAEAEALHLLEGVERVCAFWRCWARKEAFLKCTGEGLTRDLGSFVVPVVAPRQLLIHDAGLTYCLSDFSAGKGFVGAVAVVGPNLRVRQRFIQAADLVS